MERFAADKRRIRFAELLLTARGNLGIRRAGHDAVDERRTEHARMFDVVLERRIRRLGQMLQHAALERRPVRLDQFARQED